MSRQNKNRGFGLVEIMVGMVISMIASIVVFQVFASAERQKRGTTGATDAQTNGALSLSMVESDVKAAGWGLDAHTFSDCDRVFSYVDDGVSAPGAVPNLLTPAVITDGGTGPDQISIRYFDNPANANYKFALTALTAKPAAGSESMRVRSLYGCTPTVAVPKPLAIIQQSGTCTLVQITKVEKPTLTIWAESGLGAPSYNPPGAYKLANAWPAYDKGADLQCFPQLSQKTYRITNRQLELQEPDANGVLQTFQVAPDILSLQAQYGITDTCAGTPCPQKITDWVEASGAWAAPLSNANSKRIKALRVSVVARSAEYEKPGSDGTCKTTTEEAVAAWSSWAKFDITTFPADWQCYRYKVFETVVPLRNVIWGNV